MAAGWLTVHPLIPQPTVPSKDVPLLLRYVPIFIPALVLFVFLFTPLRHKLDRANGPVEVEIESSSEIDYADGSAEDAGDSGDARDAGGDDNDDVGNARRS